jgi:hypothetical protein
MRTSIRHDRKDIPALALPRSRLFIDLSLSVKSQGTTNAEERVASEMRLRKAVSMGKCD